MIMSDTPRLEEVVDLPVSRETMARQNGFVGAYGAKTWDQLIRDFYETSPELSTAKEQAVKGELEHVLQITGTTEATLDPALNPSLNRIV